MYHNILKSAIITAAFLVIIGCEKICTEECTGKESERKVMLLYSAGYNSLRNYLLDDIKELKEGWLPGNGCNEDIVLVYSHTPKARGAYNTPTTPYLIRLYSTEDGTAVADTLITYEEGTITSSAMQLNKVLTDVSKAFPAESYGMIFSSHATGYLPAGYYTDPDNYQYYSMMMKSRSFCNIPVAVPYMEPEWDPSMPMVKSIGQDQVGSSGDYLSYEINLPEFAAAIPMKLDYILFDACLMGGVEVAYELMGKCSKVGFSQAEVLAEGFHYKSITSHLLKKSIPDPKAVCMDYFTQYDIDKGVYRSATVSLIDCDKMEEVAQVCRRIFEANREGLSNINPDNVQRFYRGNKHWFYDLESIITESGADESELKDLYNALYKCVIYKGHTPEFMLEFEIDTFSGLSMYLPCNGGAELSKFYKTLRWNQATSLVE